MEIRVEFDGTATVKAQGMARFGVAHTWWEKADETARRELVDERIREAIAESIVRQFWPALAVTYGEDE